MKTIQSKKIKLTSLDKIKGGTDSSKDKAKMADKAFNAMKQYISS